MLTRWERATETFHRYSPADGIPEAAPTAFGEDASGNLWIGFYGGGLLRYGAGRFTSFTQADGLPAGFIRGLYLDRAGRLWVATADGGVARVDDPGADRPRFRVYTTADGLSSNQATCVTEDQWGKIYIGTGRGVNRLDPATGRIKQYTTADGLANNFINVSFRDRHGALWFGTLQGLSRLVPQPERPQPPPTVLISALHVAGVSQPISELGAREIVGPEVPANRNQIQIDFVGLGLAAGESLRYQYKLDGADRDWSAPKDQRTVNYPNLSPGAYRFMVRAVSADGTLSQSPATVSFRVLPPVWRRWWFVTIAALVIASAVFAFARSRYARIKALRESENRFRTLAETASDAIITIDEESRIVLVSRAAEKVFGYTRQEMVGADLTMLMPEHSRHPLQADIARDKQTGERHISWEAVELPGLHKDGREIPLEVSFGEFTRNGERFFTGIARDTTERKRAEEALRRSREERLAELERVRKRIATDLHDDIGSSLTRISLLSEVVRRQVDGVEVPLAEPLSSIARLSRELVDSMSDIVWAINPNKDHLSDLSQRMRHFASDVFTARQIDFRFRAPAAERDIKVGANVRRELFLVFKEAVNNTVRHSGCAEAEIEFRAEADGLFLKLSDNGRGFDTSHESAGHGLASMRERTEALGGHLEVVSHPAQGTTLTFMIPLGDQQPPTSAVKVG